MGSGPAAGVRNYGIANSENHRFLDARARGLDGPGGAIAF